MFALTGTQVFHDAVMVVTLIALEGLLSADNALVLAVMVRHLPKDQRSQALKYGIVGAFIFRAIGVLLAGYLIRLWYLKLIGALYLLWLAVEHFWKKHKESNSEEGAAPKKQMSFWRTVIAVELTDIAFSLDSIVTAVAIAGENLWIVYLGGVLGIITMRYIASYFLQLLDAFPALETSAYLLVAWIGLKLGTETYVQVSTGGQDDALIPKWLFWLVMGVLFFGAFLFKKKPDDDKPAVENEGTPQP